MKATEYLRERMERHPEVYDKNGKPHRYGRVYIDEAHKAVDMEHEQTLKNALDAYCKVCGHFAHDVPTYVCRLDCQYYKDFRKAMEE